MSLRGKTLFISGASRGIGKAIAIRAAQDGANVVIAAKTAEPHPKLPGTIYTAAEEIREAGGDALPCIVDIRNEEMVDAAVAAAVEEFGGIDICVNNASAIMLTGTLDTPMKRYDLMHTVNTRGTFMVSQKCLPHLLKSDGPAHILNLSPPLNLNPAWFQNHVAYTMAKYGMSMCVLGMAEEFRGKVAVNALWPRTVIATAAVQNLLGGESMIAQSRTPEIMADAAYVALTRGVEYTGNFYIDDEILRESGQTELGKYACTPGATDFAPDFFLD